MRIEDFIGFTPERNEEGSRATILGYLTLKEGDWCAARECLKGADGNILPNVWSEDIQHLVREGIVESRDPVEEMGNETMIRLRPRV